MARVRPKQIGHGDRKQKHCDETETRPKEASGTFQSHGRHLNGLRMEIYAAGSRLP
jgi:hypothetical protein